MTLLELAMLIIAIVIFLRIAIFEAKRISLLISVLRLRRLDGVEVAICSIFAFLLPMIAATPAFRVKVHSKTYAVRLFSGKGSFHAVHIVNREFAAVFMKSGGAVKVRRFVRSMRAVHEDSRVYFPRTVIMKPMERYPDEIEIMLFSPAPRELTYVSESRTSIKVVFTGDEVYGMRIFTKTTFCNFIDRDTRGFYDEQRKNQNHRK